MKEIKEKIIVVKSDQILSIVLKIIKEKKPVWIVVLYTSKLDKSTYCFALKPSEIIKIEKDNLKFKNLSLELSMKLAGQTSSEVFIGKKSIARIVGAKGPAAGRTIIFNTLGQITDVRSLKTNLIKSRSKQTVKITSSGNENFSTVLDFGSYLGGDNYNDPSDSFESFKVEHTPPSPDMSESTSESPPEEIDITLSAETKSEIQLDSIMKVKFRVELTSEKLALELSHDTKAKANLPIIISLYSGEELSIISDWFQKFDKPPAHKKPLVGYFLVEGKSTGQCSLSVSFHQEGNMLGMFSFKIEVIDSPGSLHKKAPAIQKEAPAMQKELSTDNMLTLLINRKTEFNKGKKNYVIYYEYTLVGSSGLKVPWEKFQSEPLLDEENSLETPDLKYVKNIYKKVTMELKNNDDVENLQTYLRGVGKELSESFFNDKISRIIWKLKEKICSVHIVSWDPYIPWELLMLRDPDSKDPFAEKHFLAEYGLVRNSLQDPQTGLIMNDWGFLCARFPNKLFDEVDADMNYFTENSPGSLREKNIIPTSIKNTRSAFREAVSNSKYDVMHISCHAEATEDDITESSLIIGDEIIKGNSNPRPVLIKLTEVKGMDHFKNRNPLVFLNGCETGKKGAVLTNWSGWASLFLDMGAAVFVGTSWSVRDEVAALFAKTFYNSLLENMTLYEAAKAAREATKNMGDASWLAFKVYGTPNARRVDN